MKIRAITLGCPLDMLTESLNLDSIQHLKEQIINDNIDVQTIRLCTSPFTNTTNLDDNNFFKDPDSILQVIDSYCKEGLIDYYSFLAGLCDQTISLTKPQKELILKIPILLKTHDKMFSSIQVSSKKGGISLEAIKECANIIKKLATTDPFLNLKFAATFNVPPNTPFFPSAYHLGGPKITIALEAADEVVNIMKQYSEEEKSLSWVSSSIQQRFSDIYDKISDILEPFCKKNGYIYGGIDFSPAVFPTKEKSIGTALEYFGLGHFGELGTIFAIGFLTSTIQGINRPKIGFSGFMQPLLEDFTIARRNDEGKIDISKLLLNSTVCGLGLDCIPFPGDVNEQTLSLLMLDVAMISSRLNKPLTTRLMPILGKTFPDRTEFDFEYFTNSKIMKLKPSSQKEIMEFISKNPGILI